MVEGMAVTNNIIMVISTIIHLLNMLTVSSWTLTPVISCEPCGTEELRRGAMDKVLASIGCDNFACLVYKVQPGLDPRNPAASCADVVVLGAESNTPSGYYWLRSASGSAVRVFCDMTHTCKGVGGGWMQVAKLDMTNSSHQCPPGTATLLTRNFEPPKRLCGRGRADPGCTSSVFNIHGINYSQICGRIIGYQYISPDAFGTYSVGHRNSSSIDGNYVDGISLTHGRDPRQHIWTFAGGLSETGTAPRLNCPCTNSSQAAFATQPPSFVGNDYFCDTGSELRWETRFYGDDPLWDGAGCGPDNTCCSLNNPPWFLKQLPSNTTDDIEMRMCFDQPSTDEDTAIEIIELYVR